VTWSGSTCGVQVLSRMQLETSHDFFKFVDMYLRSYLFAVCDTALRSDSFRHLYNNPEDYQHDNCNLGALLHLHTIYKPLLSCCRQSA
jgi:hypothetical protein